MGDIRPEGGFTPEQVLEFTPDKIRKGETTPALLSALEGTKADPKTIEDLMAGVIVPDGFRVVEMKDPKTGEVIQIRIVKKDEK